MSINNDMAQPDDVYGRIGKYVSDARERAKMTQEELAERIGMTRASISNIEHGRQKIQIHILYILADSLNISPLQLVSGTNSEEYKRTSNTISDDTKTPKRWSYLLISDYRILNDWCCLVSDMFTEDAIFGCYQVGSSLTTSHYRDVDIRVIIPDDVYATKYDDTKRKYLNLAVSIWGQRVTGLPIDFQIQPYSLAHERYHGATHRRQPIGHKLYDTAEV